MKAADDWGRWATACARRGRHLHLVKNSPDVGTRAGGGVARDEAPRPEGKVLPFRRGLAGAS